LIAAFWDPKETVTASAGQTFSHNLQPIHLFLSTPLEKNAYFPVTLCKTPNGQILL